MVTRCTAGRASNPLEIALRPTNLSEEILASSRHTDMLRSQQSTGLGLSHGTLGLYWFNTKNGDLERTGKADSSHEHQKTHRKKSKHRASHAATKTRTPTKQKLLSKSCNKTKYYIQFVNFKLYLKSSCSFPLFYFFFLNIHNYILVPIKISWGYTIKPHIHYRQKISPNKSQNIYTYPHSPFQSNAQTGLCGASLPQPAHVQPSIH